MDKFLTGAKTQYIDPHGKTRMLGYEEGSAKISVMISPIPPLDLEIDQTIHPTSLRNATRFAEKRKLETVFQQPVEGDSTRMRGLWFQLPQTFERTPLDYIYIPTTIENILPGLSISDENPPLKSHGISSQLSTFKEASRIGVFLEKYVMYEYSRAVRDGASANLGVEDFFKNRVTVRPRHIYDFEKLGRSLTSEGNNVMYSSSGKLIVPSEEIRTNLISYLKTQLINDKPGILEMARQRRLPDYYQTVSDFRTSPNQLVFDSQLGLSLWLASSRKRDRSEISDVFLPGEIEPYYFRSPAVESGKIGLVQNVMGGELGRALSVSHNWIFREQRNTGYKTPEIPEAASMSYVLYEYEDDLPSGQFAEKKEISGSTQAQAVIARYRDGKYAAMLFFS